jgi:excisionase family DNA binding protein
MTDPELLTPKEAATLLRMNLETVRRLLRAGELPGRKVGPRQWRIRRSDLERRLAPQPLDTVAAGTIDGR